jgi:hypothetical protein
MKITVPLPQGREAKPGAVETLALEVNRRQEPDLAQAELALGCHPLEARVRAVPERRICKLIGRITWPIASPSHSP